MKCPKCHNVIPDNSTVCPVCRKVLVLECPNCHSFSESSVCDSCGYSILVKCSKCSKINSSAKEFCSKCGFSVSTSLAYQECESDDFASATIKFNNLKSIKKVLKSKDLYSKFYFKLKNLIQAQLKGVDGKIIYYDDVLVVNFNKELSFPTSANKAVRLALKIMNIFSEINQNIQEQFNVPLDLAIVVAKKSAEDLQKLIKYESNVKLLNTGKDVKKHLKGLQVILDQFVRDEISKEYKTDSLYSIENDGVSIMFYELVLSKYVLPPTVEEGSDSKPVDPREIKKEVISEKESDLYAFKVFDINAKCRFEKTNAVNVLEGLQTVDFEKGGNIVSIRAKEGFGLSYEDIKKAVSSENMRLIRVVCTEKLNYKPWGFFETLFKDFYNLTFHNKNTDLTTIDASALKQFKALFDFVFSASIKAMTPEDARFAYMEQFANFLKTLSNTVIVVEGFQNLDDTSIQTLELYFDKFKNIRPNFIFTTDEDVSLHSKIKGLLRTSSYVEFSLKKTSIDNCLSTLKLDATDFIQSFYFEKIKENFRGSYLYFENAIEYLKESDILIEFENKLLIKNNKSVVLPKKLKDLYKSRIKNLSKDMNLSLILAYSAMLSPRLDLKIIQDLGVESPDKSIKSLCDAKLASFENNILTINNYIEIEPVIVSSLKKEAEEFLAKNILTKVGKGLDDTTLLTVLGRLSAYKEEYLTLWKNSQFAIKTGDYDAYLKNCLGFLSLVEHIESNIPQEEIEENKKDVYNNILMFLYNYSPAKIYFIENILLMDAIEQNNDEKIVKLSNLMLQGALIASNYTDALGLLHNILSRMPSAKLVNDGVINTKFLLLSLVHIEILYNIGDFKQCVEVADDILKVLSPEVLEKVKPASFSTNLFASHILETLRLGAFAKLYMLNDDLEGFFEKIKSSLNVELPEQNAILAIQDFLSGKVYNVGNVEGYNAFSKVVFLILQEFSVLNGDYKRFAQNIYQAKLLANDIHQKEIEYFCDLLIAFAYSKMGILEKAESIYQDVIETSNRSAIFNTLAISKFLMAKLKVVQNKPEDALVLISDTLAIIQKYNNQAKILYAVLEKLYIDIVKSDNLLPCDIELEQQKIEPLQDRLKQLLS